MAEYITKKAAINAVDPPLSNCSRASEKKSKKRLTLRLLLMLYQLSTLSGYTLKLRKMIGDTAFIIGIVPLAGGLKVQIQRVLGNIALAVGQKWTEVNKREIGRFSTCLYPERAFHAVRWGKR